MNKEIIQELIAVLEKYGVSDTKIVEFIKNLDI